MAKVVIPMDLAKVIAELLEYSFQKWVMTTSCSLTQSE